MRVAFPSFETLGIFLSKDEDPGQMIHLLEVVPSELTSWISEVKGSFEVALACLFFWCLLFVETNASDLL